MGSPATPPVAPATAPIVPSEPRAVQRHPDGPRSTTASALAAATGSSRRPEADGRTSVVFGTARSPDVTRRASTAPVQRVAAAEATGVVAPAPPARPAPVVADADFDAVYEALLERLRRELLIERERLGDMYSRLR
jgi:hypothetical protein